MPRIPDTDEESADELRPGLFDTVLTNALAERVGRLDDRRLRAQLAKIDPAELPDRVAEIVAVWTEAVVSAAPGHHHHRFRQHRTLGPRRVARRRLLTSDAFGNSAQNSEDLKTTSPQLGCESVERKPLIWVRVRIWSLGDGDTCGVEHAFLI